MAIAAVWREYNPSTGKLMGTVTSLSFGNVNIGEFSPIRVFDLYVPDVSFLSNVTLQITASPQITVNDSPVDITSDGTAGNGNFGIELDDNFVSRSTLSRFFAGLDQPVTIGTRADNVSKYIFMNSRMSMDAAEAGSVTYQVSLDHS